MFITTGGGGRPTTASNARSITVSAALQHKPSRDGGKKGGSDAEG